MNILQVNFSDLFGNRFNGRDLNKLFESEGHNTSHCVWLKQGHDEDTWRLSNLLYRGYFITLRDIVNRMIYFIERGLSVQSLLYPWSLQLFFDKRFRMADVVHYHLIHANYFSLLTLPYLTKMKPSVWTIHDPWAMTGHCVYPYDCDRWKHFCGSCPKLGTVIPMCFDNTRLMARIKRSVYNKLDIDLVFASKYMLNMAEASPLFENMRKHYIPFGLDLNKFRPKNNVRAMFGIPANNLVLCFRSTSYEFKGLRYIKECLAMLSTTEYAHPVTLLTFNEQGLLDEFEDKFQIIDLGWVKDEETIVNAYNCADIFLMPSTAEAFGMMAMEAMACGKPVIVFAGDNALSDTVFASQGGGIAVPYRDADALRAAIERLIKSPQERLAIGEKALELAREHYDFKVHAERMLDLYRDVIERRRIINEGILGRS